jgi:hypothetical protein
MNLWLILSSLALGAGVGVLTGLFGVGGGFLMTPLINIVLGVPMPIAVGTSAMQIVGVSTSGLYQRRKSTLTDWKLALMLFGGNLVGTRLGAQTVVALQALGSLTIKGASVPAVDFYLLIVFFVMLSAIAAWVFYDSYRVTGRPEGVPGVFARIKLPPYTRLDCLPDPISVIVLAYFGLLLGFITGLLGIGGGVVMLPALVYLVGMRTHQASATSMALVWLAGVVATVNHALAGNTRLALALPLLIGGTVGVQVGVRLCGQIGGAKLRRYFGFVVLAAVLMVALKLVSILF